MPAFATSADVFSLWKTIRQRPRSWRRNVAEAGLEDWVELIEGDALERVPGIADVFDVVFLDAEKEMYEELFQHARKKLEPGAVVIADNVLSHEDVLGAYPKARQSDPTLESVTVPLDRGLEVSVVLRSTLECGYRGKEVVRIVNSSSTGSGGTSG